MDQTLFKMVSMILGSGAFGGVVSGIFVRNSFKIRVPFSGKLIDTGFIGDALVGAAASITIFLFAGSLFNLKIDEITKTSDYLKLLSLGTLSGFAGIKLLSAMSSKLLERISGVEDRLTKVETSEKVIELVRQADFLRTSNKLDRAFIVYRKALEIDSKNEIALIGLAKVLRRMKKWNEAIAILTTIIEKNPKAERAYYNRACYKNLSGTYSKDEILSDLHKAIELFNGYKEYAVEDEDFENLWKDDAFRNEVTSSC